MAQLELYARDLRTLVARERARAAQVRECADQAVGALAFAMAARVPGARGHGDQVVHHAELLARRLGWEEGRVRAARLGALLHDAGMVGLPDWVLREPGALPEAGWQQMRRHPSIGGRILGAAAFLAPARPYAMYHHEWWDGTGYPMALAGEDIPIEGRLMAVVDAYDAMTADLGGGPARTPIEAMAELRAGAGTQFDPTLVDTFLAVLALELLS